MLLSLSVKEVQHIVSCIDNAFGDSGADYQDLEIAIKLLREVMKEQSKPEDIRWNMFRIEKFLCAIEQAKTLETAN